eukprot:1650899-Rhodomonas_salina.1
MPNRFLDAIAPSFLLRLEVEDPEEVYKLNLISTFEIPDQRPLHFEIPDPLSKSQTSDFDILKSRPEAARFVPQACVLLAVL